MQYNCSLYCAGKMPIGNLDTLSIWCYEALDLGGKKSFAKGTTWGISFPKVPARFISEPRTVFPSVLDSLPEISILADDVPKHGLPQDTAMYPVISRLIKETRDRDMFRIAFVATSEENTGTAEENLVGVTLCVLEKGESSAFVRIESKLLVAPALATTTKGAPKGYFSTNVQS